jgi:hypothetical protein
LVAWHLRLFGKEAFDNVGGGAKEAQGHYHYRHVYAEAAGHVVREDEHEDVHGAVEEEDRDNIGLDVVDPDPPPRRMPPWDGLDTARDGVPVHLNVQAEHEPPTVARMVVVE